MPNWNVYLDSIQITKRAVFLILLSLLVIQRLFEMKLSIRNKKRILKNGGIEMFSGHFPLLLLMHVSWFVVCFYLGFTSESFLSWNSFGISIGILLLCQWVRFLTIRTLGDSWNTRILVVPGKAVVNDGIYRYLRHPNYGVVVFELGLMPALCKANWAVAVFSVLNILILMIRIRAEEIALNELKDYALYASTTPRFFPLSKSF